MGVTGGAVRRWAASGAAGLAAGYAADAVFGDPRRGHPVAAFGRLAAAAERHLYRDDVAAGAGYTAVLVGAAAGVGVAAEVALRERPVARAVAVAVATWAASGGRSLAAEGAAMARLAAADDLGPARARLSHLCSRDAADLDADELARASIESVAENTSDAVTGPLWWGAVAGLPGVLAHRAANTLDAMVGYRNPRYERFGKASARLDDALGYGPSRLTAAATLACAPLVGGRPAQAWRAWRRDAPAHPSPNAGPVEATAAGALGVRIGGANTYGGRLEDRGALGDGPPAALADLPRAVTLSRAVGLACLAATAGPLAALALTIKEHRG